MKKIILSLLVLMASVASIQAQDLFKTVRDNATKVVNNPSSSDEEIQINQFKVTALNYLTMMVQKRGLKKDTYFYDSQAVNMTSGEFGKGSCHLSCQAYGNHEDLYRCQQVQSYV